jgi:hypothetical protein
MKVLIIGTSSTGGGQLRTIAYRNFLQSKNHDVTVIQFPGTTISSKSKDYYLRGRARVWGHEDFYLRKTADYLERRIREGKYDVVIGVETPWSYVLTRELNCLKIFSCETLEADELYFSKDFGDLERVRRFREMELEVLTKSDYVIFPWKTTEQYTREYIWNGDNFVTVKFGCYPQNKTASYFFPVSLVSLGSLRSYWSNKELLSLLTRVSPYTIDVYGKYRPPRKFRLNYKGFAKSTSVLSNYQFGINTTAKHVFRLHASRIMNYLAYGLPVFSPDWLQFSHELKGVIPYNEENFVELIEKNSERNRWENLSNEAYEQAHELDWNLVLQPLEKIISK